MRKRVKEPPTPLERYNTIRRYIVSLLEGETLSAKDISVSLRVPEKDVYDHLEHIRKTLHTEGQHLTLLPPRCEKCGFEFRKRTRLTKPGKCPICHSTLIKPPLYSIGPTSASKHED
jgi:transcriptional regulator